MKVGQRVKKQVYLTDEEIEYLNSKLQEYGNNFSSLCRYALLHLDDTSAKKKIEACTLHNQLLTLRERELSAIGNNINQIAHQVNIFAIDGKIPEHYVVDIIIPALDNLYKILDQIDKDQLKIKKRLY